MHEALCFNHRAADNFSENKVHTQIKIISNQMDSAGKKEVACLALHVDVWHKQIQINHPKHINAKQNTGVPNDTFWKLEWQSS